LSKSGPEGLWSKQEARQSIGESVGARCNRSCDGCNEALETEDVEHAGKVVTERHQAPFAANLVEAAKEEVAIAGAAFEGAEGVLDNGGPAAHQSVCACTLHPRAMTFD